MSYILVFFDVSLNNTHQRPGSLSLSAIPFQRLQLESSLCMGKYTGKPI